MNTAFINYLLPAIMYEKKTRTKTDHPEYWVNDCFQHSHITAFQQRERGAGLSYDTGLPVCSLDDFHCDFFCNRKKV